MASATISLPQVTVTAAPTSQSIIGLPQVSVTNPGSTPVSISLPQVTVSKPLTVSAITLPQVTVSSAQQTYTVPRGQLHLRADGTWGPFIVVHLGSDGKWRNLADGAVVTATPTPSRPAMPTIEPSGFTRQQAIDFSTVPTLPVGSFVVTKGGANDGLLTSGSAAYNALGASTIKFYPDGTNDTYSLTQAYPSKVLSVEAAQDGQNALSINHHTETVSGTSVPMGAWARLLWPDASVQKTYGRMSTCLRSDNTPGYGFVSLIIGSNTQNEMDWFETDLAWSTTLGGNHHVGPSNANPGAPHHFPDNGTVLPNLSTWHVCTTEWSPNLVRYLLDGVEIYRNTDAGSSPFKFVNIQTGASQAGVTPDPTVAGKLRVAWTTIASWNGSGSAAATYGSSTYDNSIYGA